MLTKLKDIRDNMTNVIYNMFTNNKKFYNISPVSNRAHPVYGQVLAGYYTRYFICRTQQIKYGPVIEIDLNQYANLSSNPNFIVVEIPWNVCGPLEDGMLVIAGKEVPNPGVISQNKALVLTASEKIPALIYYIKEHYDEYHMENCPAYTPSPELSGSLMTSSEKYSHKIKDQTANAIIRPPTVIANRGLPRYISNPTSVTPVTPVEAATSPHRCTLTDTLIGSINRNTLTKVCSFSPSSEVPFRITAIKYYSGTYSGTDAGTAYFNVQIVPPNFYGTIEWHGGSMWPGGANVANGGSTIKKAGFSGGYYWFPGVNPVYVPLTLDISYSDYYYFPTLDEADPGHGGGILFQADAYGNITTKMRDVLNQEIWDGHWGQVYNQIYTLDYPGRKALYPNINPAEGDSLAFGPDEGHIGLGWQLCYPGIGIGGGYDSITSDAGEMYPCVIKQIWTADDDFFYSEAGYQNQTEYQAQWLNTPDNGYPLGTHGNGGPLSPVTGNPGDYIAFVITMDGNSSGGDTLTDAWAEISWEPYYG